MSTTEPSYRELSGYWTNVRDAAAATSSGKDGPPTPSEARAMLKTDHRIPGYFYEKSHPDVAYVLPPGPSPGVTFVPSEDWVSVVRADDKFAAGRALSQPAGATTGKVELVDKHSRETGSKAAAASSATGDVDEVFNWEDPPPDHSPLKADEDESADADIHEEPEHEIEELPQEETEEIHDIEYPVDNETAVVDNPNQTDPSGNFAPVAALGLAAALCI